MTSTPATGATIVLPPVEGLGAASDARLVQLQREAAVARRRVDAVAVAIAAELVRRSDRSLGQDALSARLGASTPEKAIQALTGVTRAEARTLTAVAAAVRGESEWLAPVAAELAAGSVTVAAAAAIASGLGTPSTEVPAAELREAARDLLSRARDATPESVAASARQARERMDSARMIDLEALRRDRRTLTWSVLPDGMTRMTALLDPESAAIVTTAIDTVLAPRRGGPRFVDASGEREKSDLDDTRTSAQLAADTLVDIVQLAVRASGSEIDPAHLFGMRTPGVRVHVQAADLRTGDGFAYIEGQTAFVSLTTATRLACETGWLPVLFDGDASIDATRTQRLHSTRQRIAIAAAWNGCAWHGCTRPPSMTEIHHLEAWNGCNTTLANGTTRQEHAARDGSIQSSRRL